MQAIVARKLSDTFDQVVIEDRPIPEPGPGQVRVRMRYAPINPSDRNAIFGTYLEAMDKIIWNQGEGPMHYDPDGENPVPEPPYVLGGEGLGVVDAAGSGLMAKRLMGKRVAVAAGPPMGSWQDYTIVDAKRAVPMPRTIDDQQGAMFFVNPLTVYAMIRHVLAVPKGAWLLQSAAGSALGKSVVKMAKRFGFRTINVVRSDANVDALKALGADEIIVTSREDLIERVYAITGGKGVDYATDCVGGEWTEQLIRCLGRGGHLLVYGTLSDTPVTLHQRHLMMPTARLSGFFLPNWLATQSPLTLLGALRGVKKLMAAGVFANPVDAVMPLGEIQAALAASIERGRTGKILLDIGADSAR